MQTFVHSARIAASNARRRAARWTLTPKEGSAPELPRVAEAAPEDGGSDGPGPGVAVPVSTRAACAPPPRRATPAPPEHPGSRAVISRNASSSDVDSAASSSTPIPCERANFATSRLSIPVTRRVSPLSGSASAPASRTIPRSRPGSWLRTRTTLRQCAAVKSERLMSASSLPCPMMISWSAVTAISFIRWLESSTVCPAAARSLSRFRSQRTPSGSSPLTGSSSSSTSGSPNTAAAMPSRWDIPSEKPPDLRSPASERPTMSSTSRTRDGGIRWVRASHSKWCRALRVRWVDVASNIPPTCSSGSVSSR